ncbi:signal peptidase I [Pelagibacterium halotolerans]|uniref:Signal peptidase I n=1 Tax=Pelagibacterium halotolerans (strain DSM 22347 / JCM 15775 / CGMCC 1.7692 / B2) TaxID=1082931 RepID=G4R622_PELHB|nr:signal peptidase I [Pelagibacterium halotolerans B2]QJR20610.1 signal peptidase I [Pelagibacterium halotolerans]SEA69881.1 signal peptidase I [Pelagibacterium halotolerans]
MSDAAKKKTGKGELRETIVIIVQALLIALVFRTFAFEPFSIPTASMQSNLMIGDYILASKYSYGYSRYSLPYSEVPWNGRILGNAPQRGDIAVIRPVPQSENYVKRVIGLPGDQIQMIDGRLTINGETVEREQVGDTVDRDSTGVDIPVIEYRETLPNGVSYITQEISDNAQFDNTGVYTVPPGHYFMMGDNRDRSLDSRSLSAVGYVPFENFVGKAQWRFFSINDNIPPWQIWRWPGNVRFDRMFTSVYQ